MKKFSKSTASGAALFLALTGTGQAATVAIIDSGVDNEHNALAAHMWTNPSETPSNNADDDWNFYVDDIFGWNFAERNPLVIDRTYLGSFSPVPQRFFELQKKGLLGELTEEEKNWLVEVKADKIKMKELQKFGNFVHGTHVAGIVVSQSQAAQIMALKIIPTEVKLPFLELARRQGITFPLVEDSKARVGEKTRDFILRSLLTLLAKAQGIVMSDVGKYIHRQQASVANGSFGVSGTAAQGILSPLLRIAFGRAPSEEELATYTNYFINGVIGAQKALVNSSKETLFVFAAGNDGTDNDIFPVSPANIKTDNSLAVAATVGDEKLAPFSNFGDSMVEVAAPGTAIESASPGNETLFLSGTSQAAPFVAGVAAAIREINPLLSPLNTKAILMQTVEKYDFLTSKVSSGGIVNLERASQAAHFSLTMDLETAIAQALIVLPQKQKQNSVERSLSARTTSKQTLEAQNFVLPLPLPFAPMLAD